jgi:hypothetical protein
MMAKIKWAMVWGLLLVVMTASVVYAQSESGETSSGGEIQSLLLPLIAAATVVERLIELIFNWYESAVLQLSTVPGLASKYVRWARQEVRRLQEAFSDSLSPEEAGQLEQALKDAENRLAGFIKSAQYVSTKRAVSLVLGFVFGLLIAFGLKLRLFALLGVFSVPDSLTWLDMLVTGLLIGTGSGPMHSLIGLLQNTKDAVDSARALWKGEALTRAIDFEATLEELAQLKQNQTWMTDRLRTMGAEEELPAPPAPDTTISRVQLSRRAERLLSK